MEILNLLSSYLKPFSEMILGIMTIIGTLLSIKIYLFTKRSDTINLLAKQVVAYYCLEQELLNELSDKTGKSVQTLQKEMRQRAQINEKNIEKTYPNITPSKAKQLLKCNI